MESPLDPKMLAYRAAPGRFDVLAGHIVMDAGRCTCAAPDVNGYATHEHGCGAEPVMTVEEFRALPDEELGKLLRSAGLDEENPYWVVTMTAEGK